MSVYRLKDSDTNLAIEVARLFFQKEVTLLDVQIFLKGENNYLLIYRYKEGIAGFAYGYELNRFEGSQNMMYVHQVEVLPEFRKLGIGRKLMEGFITLCKKKNCSKLFLITNKSNVSAIALYNSIGGEAPYEDDIVYTFSG